jgi:hypothetical protein
MTRGGVAMTGRLAMTGLDGSKFCSMYVFMYVCS